MYVPKTFWYEIIPESDVLVRQSGAKSFLFALGVAFQYDFVPMVAVFTVCGTVYYHQRPYNFVLIFLFLLVSGTVHAAVSL